MQQFSQGSYCCQIEHFETDEISRLIVQLISRYNTVANEIGVTAHRLQTELKQQEDLLKLRFLGAHSGNVDADIAMRHDQ
jgi:hypothetical protein